MTSRDLSPLFNFSSMAFVGASDSSHFGLGAFRAMTDIGFKGSYYPVNPKRDVVHGVTAYPSVSAIPTTISSAIIAVARPHVLAAFEEAAIKGARAIVVLSGNFAEVDEEGLRLQEQLRDAARAHGVLLIGPNCMGAASVRHGCALYQGRGLGPAIKGGISVVSQSGGLMNEFLHYGNARALGFCYLVSSGNEADVTCAEIIEHYAGDPDTRVIVAIIETVREPALFLAALDRAAVSRKPVILLKLGSSLKGAMSALTHTGALAGNDAVWDALLEQKAAIRARDIDELVDLAAVFAQIGSILETRPLERAAVIEISGGSCELICDVAEAAGVALPEPSAETVAAIKPTLQGFMTIGNPVDTGLLWVNPAMAAVYPPALEAFAIQDDIDIVVSRFIVPPEDELGGLNDRLNELDATRKAHPDRLFVVASPTSNKYHPQWRDALARYSLAFVPGFGRAFSTLGKLARYSRLIRAWSRPPVTAVARQVVAANAPAIILNEVDSKRLLAEAGLPTVTTYLARSAAEAIDIGERIGFPVAAKLMSPQMTHKSDVGGVRLNVRNVTELKSAFEDFTRLVAATPGAVFEGMSVQTMAPPGLELVLGAHRDPQFGPVVMFGLGGIFVEVLKDTMLRVAPLSQADAEAMVDGIRASEMLRAVRGRSAVDRSAILTALLGLSRLMTERPDIESIDINPAFAYSDRLLIADARMVLREAAHSNGQESPLAKNAI